MPRCSLEVVAKVLAAGVGTCLATLGTGMEIQFVSSLTADDEKRLAPGLLELVCAILDQLPVAYTLRIRTTTGETLQRTKAEAATRDAANAD